MGWWLALIIHMQYEVDLYQTESNCQTPLERQYHTEILALERTKRRQNQRIFTYTDFDRFAKWEEVSKLYLLYNFKTIIIWCEWNSQKHNISPKEYISMKTLYFT